MNDEIINKIKLIISNQLGVDESEISANSHLQDDLNADPLSIDDLLTRLENEFAIKIPEDQAQGFATVGDIVNYIAEQTGEI